MKRTWRVVLVGLATAAVMGGGGMAAMAAPVAAAPADQQLAGELALQREEERMARDLYTLFVEKYQQDRPFGRIAQAEQRHFDRVGQLLTAYELADPSAGKAAGVYDNQAIQQQYDAWKKQGLQSVQDAYNVGVDLETKDIAGLKKAIEETEEADADQVWTSLLRGSEHHLAAFTAAANGEPIEPGSGMGPRWGDGQGPGNGPRNGTAPRNGMGDGRQGRGQMDGEGVNCPR